MKKAEFELKVQEALTEVGFELNKKESGQITEAVFQVVFDLVTQGEEVPVGVLGKITSVERGERKARNPQDGTEIIVPAHHAPKYKPSKVIKDVLKGK